MQSPCSISSLELQTRAIRMYAKIALLGKVDVKLGAFSLRKPSDNLRLKL